MAVTVFDVDGKNPTTGTIEVWRAGERVRVVETIGATAVTLFRNGPAIMRSAAGSDQLVLADIVLQQAIDPIPAPVLNTETTFRSETRSLAKEKFDCISPVLTNAHSPTITYGPGLQYCFASGEGAPAFWTQPAGYFILRVKTGVFEGRHVPIELRVYRDRVLLAEMHTVSLATFTPAPADFLPAEGLVPFDGPVEMDRKQIAPLLISQTPPVYPAEAKASHAEGSVNFDAIIGTDGHVASLKVVGTAAPSLVGAAKDAVQHWIYRPFLLAGTPVEVKARITVNFNISGD